MIKYAVGLGLLAVGAFYFGLTSLVVGQFPHAEVEELYINKKSLIVNGVELQLEATPTTHTWSYEWVPRLRRRVESRGPYMINVWIEDPKGRKFECLLREVVLVVGEQKPVPLKMNAAWETSTDGWVVLKKLFNGRTGGRLVHEGKPLRLVAEEVSVDLTIWLRRAGVVKHYKKRVALRRGVRRRTYSGLVATN